MLTIFEKCRSIHYQIQFLFLLICISTLLKPAWTRLNAGAACSMQSITGVCRKVSDCEEIYDYIYRGDIEPHQVLRCGYSRNEEIICCPSPSRTGVITTPNPPPLSVPVVERAAVKACRMIEQTVNPYPNVRVLGGTSVQLGEFPYVVGIGYSRIGSNTGPYDIRCGATLIDARFVLTAAHCVNGVRNPPSIVRLGVINNKDDKQIESGLEIRIKKIHIHPDYTSTSIYNDIALLELENSIQFSYRIYPICLYTETEDPTDDSVLYVIGWGITDLSTRASSDVLMKAALRIVPLDACNNSIYREGITSRNPNGVIQTQVCAVDPEIKTSSCRGDSGGPLSIVLDPTWRVFRVLGIISAGYSCGTNIPSLYTRVAAYLDFIEDIVWPHLK
ncbi:serine protease Hayan-like [Teleopsis dalmanni]|uniref:serine protease Hayan-like n=1 Tax=Teleopsis dalmanni TaxID=139649 RepID=UPI000D32B4FC|nr:serine protease Hayan-like [Teleopsis dalmanni]